MSGVPNMNKFVKKLFGIDQLEKNLETTKKALEDLEAKKAESEAAAKSALEAEELAKLTPKERATRKGEPWVAVLDTHVNKDNIRNGFFELDWNDLFILQLKQAGYGFDGDPNEEIVDRWFRDIVRNMLTEEGMDPLRGAGYINVIPINKNQSEVS